MALDRFDARSTLLSLLSLSLLFGAAACKEKGEIPDGAEERTETIAKKLPASSTGSVVVFADIPKFRKAFAATKKTVSRLLPVDSFVQQAAGSETLGKLLGDEETKFTDDAYWKDRGIPPKKGAVGLAQVERNALVMAFVDKKQKFNKNVLDAVGADKSSEVNSGDYTFNKAEGDTKALWAYDGNLAVVATHASGVENPNDLASTLANVLDTKKKDSVHASEGFSKYRKAVGSSPALAYFQPSVYLNSEMVDTSDIDQQTRETIATSLDGGGFDVETSDNKAKLRLWLGLTEEGRNYVGDWFESPKKADWTNFVNEDLLLGVRAGGNWKNVWNSYKSSLGKTQKQQLDAQLKMGSQQLGMDLEKEVIGNMTGQSGLFVYGIGGKASPSLMRQPLSLLEKLRAAYVVKLADSEVLGKLADKAQEMASEHVTVRPLEIGKEDGDNKTVRSISAVDIKAPERTRKMVPADSELFGSEGEAPVRFYIHEDRLVLATTTIPEKQIHRMLTGSGDGASSLTDVEKLDLGGEFASDEQLAGLYLNIVRARDIMSKFIKAMPIPKLKSTMETLQEILLSTSRKDQGMFVDLAVDMEANAGSSAGGGAQGGDKKKKKTK